MGRPTVGVALGSGGARGVCYIGVLEELEKNVKIDMVAGSSIGALIAASYFAGLSVEKMIGIAYEVNRLRTLRALSPSIVPLRGVFTARRFEKRFLEEVPAKRIEDLRVKLFITALRLSDGKEVVFEKGSLLKAVRASVAIPGVFTPVKVDNDYYADGGVVDPVPVKVLRERGADVVIAVEVVPKGGRRRLVREPFVWETVFWSLSAMRDRLREESIKDADVVIRIESELRTLEFWRAADFIEYGRAVVRQNIDRIRKAIEQWGVNEWRSPSGVTSRA